MENENAQKVLDVFEETGVIAEHLADLKVVGSRIENILVILGMNSIPRVVTDLKTVAGKSPLIVIESTVAFTKPAIQIITDALKAFAMISVEDQRFESEERYSGNILFLMQKLENEVLVHIEIPFFEGCVSSLGTRAMMKFLDAVTG